MIAKRRIVCMLLAFASFGGMFGCIGPTATVEPEITPSEEEVSYGLNLLIAVEGEVFLKRDGWTDYIPTSFGADIKLGDLIRPADGQSVAVLCADLSLHTVEREEGCPCRVQEPKLERDEVSVLAPKNPPELIPYILYPRHTIVLDDHPFLRWYDTGSTSYTVSIMQGSEEVWKQSGVHSSEMRYPDDAPLLQPGEEYLLMVKDEDTDHHSGKDPAKGLGFRLVSPEDREVIEARSAEIRALDLDDTSQRFALAVYYAGEGLRGEALALLDGIDSTNLPAVSLWRGDLLLAMRLADEAEAAYQEALACASATGNAEAQALACAGLWRVTGSQDYLDAALELYDEIGEKTAAGELREEAGQ